MPTPQEFQISCGVGVGACPVFSLFILIYLLDWQSAGSIGKYDGGSRRPIAVPCLLHLLYRA